jgi:SAM-dependent methyltransferase
VPGDVRTGVDVSLDPKQAFEAFVDELLLSLPSRGLSIDSLSLGGRLTEGDTEVGVVEKWEVGKRITILWRPKPWEPRTTNKLSIEFSATRSGTRITVESRNWGRIVGGDSGELLGWFTGEVVAPLLSASGSSRLGDWITDRHARRPSGESARKTYANPVYHWPNFFAILDVLKLGPKDNLVEVGCGGGAFLHEALKSGCHASAIDHSAEMVRLATNANRSSISKGRLRVALGEADRLPFPSGTFTCAVMTGVLFFLPDPAKAFKEVFRVLKSGGRFVLFTGSKQIQGTPAAPEPMASRGYFYDDGELEGLAMAAGFAGARVEHPSLFEYAKKSGVPKSDLGLFRGTTGGQLLVCHKK